VQAGKQAAVTECFLPFTEESLFFVSQFATQKSKDQAIKKIADIYK